MHATATTETAAQGSQEPSRNNTWLPPVSKQTHKEAGDMQDKSLLYSLGLRLDRFNSCLRPNFTQTLNISVAWRL
ncbi:hypothetical protein NHX12_002728 [Muraenolepis orangiensis]|uniref:Uncharacterized protein n=1 Tax=Muraenolepis orangiensis TaxID=630683 RepID=A0A9Q0IF03_9TELE|nr:hypothetical protein NHX12_002728 [Muraenolepis orangiensis]